MSKRTPEQIQAERAFYRERNLRLMGMSKKTKEKRPPRGWNLTAEHRHKIREAFNAARRARAARERAKRVEHPVITRDPYEGTPECSRRMRRSNFVRTCGRGYDVCGVTDSATCHISMRERGEA
jgi:hypothetical protein